VSDFLIVVYHHPMKILIVDFGTHSQKVFALLNAHKSKSRISMKRNLPNVNKTKHPEKKRGRKKIQEDGRTLISPESNVHCILNFGSFCWEGD
jgi:hypothetical protein